MTCSTCNENTKLIFECRVCGSRFCSGTCARYHESLFGVDSANPPVIKEIEEIKSNDK